MLFDQEGIMELIEYFKEAEENSIRFSEIGKYPDSIGFSPDLGHFKK
jgi:hypothetical protein